MGVVEYIESVFEILEPTGSFIHGSDFEKNIKDSVEFPILYLSDPIFSNDTFAANGYFSSVYQLEIFFALKSKLDFKQKEHYELIEPMRELSRKFLLSVFKDTTNVKSLSNIRRFNAINLMDVNVTGIILQVQIELYNTSTSCL